MKPVNDTCLVCGDPATALCDFVLGFQITRTLPYPAIGADSPAWTCDAPLCAAHAAHAGNVFFSGKEHSVDTIDHCPVHRGDQGAIRPMFKEDADYLRGKAWVEIQRGTLRVVKPETTSPTTNRSEDT